MWVEDVSLVELPGFAGQLFHRPADDALRSAGISTPHLLLTSIESASARHATANFAYFYNHPEVSGARLLASKRR